MRRIVFVLFLLFIASASTAKAIALSCGQASPNTNDTCSCTAGGFNFVPNTSLRCCGWLSTDANNGCASAPSNPVAIPFDTLNNAIFPPGHMPAGFSTPLGILNGFIPYLFTIGGIILFLMLIWGGFEMLTGAANPKSQEAGKQRISAAIIGFILLFASYWLAQLVQGIFGISIL